MSNPKTKSHKPKPSLTKVIEPPKSKLRSFLDRTWKIITAIILIIGGIASYISIKNSLKPPEQQFEEQNTESGNLKPPKLNYSDSQRSQIANDGIKVFVSSTPPIYATKIDKRLPPVIGIHVTDFNIDNPIYVECGDKMFYLEAGAFYKGVDVLKTLGDSCSNTTLILGLKDDRLYISTEFKRLQNEETMGVIEYNHWTLYKDNILKYRYNDTMLEVSDKQNKIAFSIKYGHTSMQLSKGNLVNGVVLAGYFLGDTSITVINSRQESFRTCFFKSDPNWKQKASVKISKIKSLWN